MAMGLNMARTAAQTPTDTAYERTMRQLATYKNIVIDTVDATVPPETYMYGYHDYGSDKIHMVHFFENRDSTQPRNPHLVWGRKYMENYIAHERTHARNNELFQRAILKDIFENTQYRIYDEISATVSEIIKLREQMARLYHERGHIVITDLYGYESINAAKNIKQNISIEQLYQNAFAPALGYMDYYTYIMYLINNPSVLNGPVRGIEFDYILMTAVNLMDDRFSIYLDQTATEYYRKPTYVNLIYLASMHNNTYQELLPDPTKPARETAFHIFKYAFDKMGFDMDAPAPKPEQIRRAARDVIAKFKSGEITALSFDELIQQTFTFDGVKYLAECRPETNAAILEHMDKYMEHVGDKWDNDFETVNFHNMFIETSWNNFHNQIRIVETLQNKKHR